MLGQNEQSQIKSDREVFGIFQGGESKTEVVLRLGVCFMLANKEQNPTVLKGRERESHNTLFSAQKGVNSATQWVNVRQHDSLVIDHLGIRPILTLSSAVQHLQSSHLHRLKRLKMTPQ